MPFKNGRLTPKEAKYVESYASTGDRAAAERAAGYAPGAAAMVSRRPDIQAQIVQEQAARLSIEGAPLAVNTLFEVMRNQKAPAAARIQAAKIVLDRAMPSETGQNGEGARELTAEEIAAAIAAYEARLVDVTPVEPKPDPGAIFE